MYNNDSPGRRVWRIITPFLLYYMMTFAVEMIFMTVILSQHPGIMQMGNYDEMLTAASQLAMEYQVEMSVLAAAAALPVLVNLMRRDYRDELAAGELKVYEKPDPLDYIGVAVMGLAMSILMNCLIDISGLYEVLDGEAVTEQARTVWGGRFVMELLGLGVLSAAVEEVAFRGLTLPRLEKYSSEMWALIGSSLMFSLAHGSSIQGIYAFGIGLIAGFLFLKFRTVIAPFIFHMSSNILSVFQNETGFLDRYLDNTASLTVLCLVAAGAFLAYFYYVLVKVDLKELTADQAGFPSREASSEERKNDRLYF